MSDRHLTVEQATKLKELGCFVNRRDRSFRFFEVWGCGEVEGHVTGFDTMDDGAVKLNVPGGMIPIDASTWLPNIDDLLDEIESNHWQWEMNGDEECCYAQVYIHEQVTHQLGESQADTRLTAVYQALVSALTAEKEAK